MVSLNPDADNPMKEEGRGNGGGAIRKAPSLSDPDVADEIEEVMHAIVINHYQYMINPIGTSRLTWVRPNLPDLAVLSQMM